MKLKLHHYLSTLCLNFLLICPTFSARILSKSIDQNKTEMGCQTLQNVKQAQPIPQSTSQIIIVNSTKGFLANITACQRSKDGWFPVFKHIPGVIGEKGIAAIGTKREGDRKTPAGFYPFGEAFGTQPLALHMDYKYITNEDKFIDDMTSHYYNTWVNGPTDAKSYETMLIPPYKMGAVINYNINPTIPGAGSAIFMHIWLAPNKPTLGCVAMDEQSLSNLLHWLDKKQHPHIYIE